MSKVVSEKGFKQKSSVKHVKTRTPYKVVDHYEKEFKHSFAEMVGDMMDEYIDTMSEMLNTGKIKIQKSETEFIDVLNSEADRGIEGNCGHAHPEI